MSMAHQGFTTVFVAPLTATVVTDIVNGTSTNTITFSVAPIGVNDTVIVVYRADGVGPASASITGHSGVTCTLGNRQNGYNDSIGIISFKVTSGLLSGGGTRDLVLNTAASELYAHGFIVSGGGHPTFTQQALQGVTNATPLSVTASGVGGTQLLVACWNATTTTAGTPASVTNSLPADATTGTQVGVVADLCIESASTTASLASTAGAGQMIAAAWFTV